MMEEEPSAACLSLPIWTVCIHELQKKLASISVVDET